MPVKPLWALALTACVRTSSTPLPTPDDVESFRQEQSACLANGDTREAVDACRGASKARMCARFPDVAPDCPLKPSDWGQLK